MTSSPSMAETTSALERIAQQVEELGRSNIYLALPADLVAAAERLVKAMVMNPYHVDAPAVVPISSVPLHDLLDLIIFLDEEIDLSTIRRRLDAAGRPVKPSALSVAIHRALARGQLERVAPRRYRRPAHSAADGPSRSRKEAGDVELASSDDEVAEAAV